MAKPIEFGEFYKLLREARDGNDAKDKELQWILAEYEHAKDAKSAYDELGQIFCHHGVMELYDYTGIDDIKYINSLEKNIWEYLNFRMKVSIEEYMVKSMLNHAKEHRLSTKISKKWNTSIPEIDDNMEGLAQYVAEGIMELIGNNG